MQERCFYQLHYWTIFQNSTIEKVCFVLQRRAANKRICFTWLQKIGRSYQETLNGIMFSIKNTSRIALSGLCCMSWLKNYPVVLFDTFSFLEHLIIDRFGPNLACFILRVPLIDILCKTLPTYLEFSYRGKNMYKKRCFLRKWHVFGLVLAAGSPNYSRIWTKIGMV